MPLSGGASAKTGQTYESLWTVHCMTRVLTGDADSIFLEPPGETGAEFCVETGSGVEYHQVKRQISGPGNWSLSALDRKGVLEYFNEKLNDPSATCVFVSGHSAHPLDELASRARYAGSFREFLDSFLSSSEWFDNFSKLHNHYRWGKSDEDAYQRLKRVYVHTIDESWLRESAVPKLELLVNEVPESAIANLSDFALQQIHQTLNSADIWRHLESREFIKRAWGQSVADSVRELTESYAAGIQADIGGEVVNREELGRIFRALDGDEKRVALVTGKAGAGKSSLMRQAISEAQARDWTVLALREVCLK